MEVFVLLTDEGIYDKQIAGVVSSEEIADRWLNDGIDPTTTLPNPTRSWDRYILDEIDA